MFNVLGRTGSNLKTPSTPPRCPPLDFIRAQSLHSADSLSQRIKRKPIMFKLELTLQNLALKEYTLSGGAKLSIGRYSENDIVLKDMSVSRHYVTPLK